MGKTRGSTPVRQSRRQRGIDVSLVAKEFKNKRKPKEVTSKAQKTSASKKDKECDVGGVLEQIPEEVETPQSEQEMVLEEDKEAEVFEKETEGKADEEAEEEAEGETEEEAEVEAEGESEEEDEEEDEEEAEKEAEEEAEKGAEEEADREAEEEADKETEVTAEVTSGVNQNTGTAEAETQHPQKRRTRGLTKMRRVAKDVLSKVDVEFTLLGEHAGSGSVTLSSFLGPLVREHVPYLYDDWRQVDDQIKDSLWEEIQVKRL